MLSCDFCNSWGSLTKNTMLVFYSLRVTSFTRFCGARFFVDEMLIRSFLNDGRFTFFTRLLFLDWLFEWAWGLQCSYFQRNKRHICCTVHIVFVHTICLSFLSPHVWKCRIPASVILIYAWASATSLARGVMLSVHDHVIFACWPDVIPAQMCTETVIRWVYAVLLVVYLTKVNQINSSKLNQTDMIVAFSSSLI